MPEYDERIHDELLALTQTDTTRLLYRAASALPGANYEQLLKQVQPVIADVLRGDKEDARLAPGEDLAEKLHALLAQRLEAPDPWRSMRPSQIESELVTRGIGAPHLERFRREEFSLASGSMRAQAYADFFQTGGLPKLMRFACEKTGESLPRREGGPLPPIASWCVDLAATKTLDESRIWRPNKVDFQGFIFGVLRSVIAHRFEENDERAIVEIDDATNPYSTLEDEGLKRLTTEFSFQDILSRPLHEVMYLLATDFSLDEKLEERVRKLGAPLADQYEQISRSITAEDDLGRIEQFAVRLFEPMKLPARRSGHAHSQGPIADLKWMGALDDRLRILPANTNVELFRKLLYSYRLEIVIDMRLQDPGAKPRGLLIQDHPSVASIIQRANAKFKEKWRTLCDTLKMGTSLTGGGTSPLEVSFDWEEKIAPGDTLEMALCLNQVDLNSSQMDQLVTSWVGKSKFDVRLQISGTAITPDWISCFGYRQSQTEDHPSRIVMLTRRPEAYPKVRDRVRDWALCLGAVTNPGLCAKPDAPWRTFRSGVYNRTLLGSGALI